MGTGPASWKYIEPVPDMARIWEKLISVAADGWGEHDPNFRVAFGQLFVPDASAGQLQWFAKAAQLAAARDMAVEILKTMASMDVREHLHHVRCQTLLLHNTHELLVPILGADLLKEGIPHAEERRFDSKNHILLEDEPAWSEFQIEFNRFTSPIHDLDLNALKQRFGQLSIAEKRVLRLKLDQFTSTQIATLLGLATDSVYKALRSIRHKTHLSDDGAVLRAAHQLGLAQKIRKFGPRF